MLRLPLCAILAVSPMAPLIAAEKRPMEIQDLFRFKRVADPRISPDGKNVVYQVTTVNYEENKSTTNLWIASTDGKSFPRQLTTSAKSDKHPRWSPDGKRILFESNRSGDSQIWEIEIDGGEAQQLTTISTGASNAIWSPEGSHIAFVSAVYPEFSDKPFKESDALNKKKLDEAAKSPVKARVFTRLFFRHWAEYVEDKRQHLFVLQLHYRLHESPEFPMPTWEPLDVTPGDRDAYPTSTTFSEGDDFTFSPSGSCLVYTAVPDRDEAWSTNYDICRVSIHGVGPEKKITGLFTFSVPARKIETLTADNKAADGSPQFSGDGKKLAYRAQKKAGYEADKWDVMVVDVDKDGAFQGKPKNVTSDLDLSVHSVAWLGTRSNYLTFTADEGAETATYLVNLISGKAERFHFDRQLQGTISSLGFAEKGGNSTMPTAVFVLAQMDAPPEVYLAPMGDAEELKPVIPRNLSRANEKLLAEIDRPRPESVKVKVEGGTMQMWILKPPGFDEKKKWPVVYLVHGGPQSAWSDGWSFRWNPELWAAQGYVVAMPNPRGSTGFGQKFVDDISSDWGGKCYDDLMKGADYIETLPYVDKERIAAAGGSFGGYMMNWFAVNTPRFKTLVTHCSVWNAESMWGTTDELWFDEYEHGGLPWEKPESYAKFSPQKKAGNLGKFKTPMLIIHNDLDFRCPIGQGHELFSALQRQGVPSRFVNFPDEGHWVLKPKNSELWHKEIFAWLKKYCPPGGK